MRAHTNSIHLFLPPERHQMQESQVTVHGMWASIYVYPVIWALKLKKVKYEYIEEDVFNKSSSLLELNPVYKKVPVLVHDGKVLAESSVILQYIDETWPHQPNLLPSDPYEKAIARFWSDFADKMGPTFSEFMLSSDEDKEKTAKQVLETLKIIQDQALGEKRFFGGEIIGFVDFKFGWLAHWFETIQEFAGVQILVPNTLPKLHQWTINFKQEPIIKDSLPDYSALLAHCKWVKERYTPTHNN